MQEAGLYLQSGLQTFNQAGLGFSQQKAVILSFFQVVTRPVLAQAAAEWKDRNTYVEQLCEHLSCSGQGGTAANTPSEWQQLQRMDVYTVTCGDSPPFWGKKQVPIM